MINSDTAPTPPDPHAANGDRMENFASMRLPTAN